MIDITKDLLISNFKINEDVFNVSEQALKDIKDQFSIMDNIREYNQLKVLSAFQEERISDMHFTNSSGYGYGDIGRDTLDKVFARIFNTEAA
ncbi:MAG: methionine gamma-lyase family protein, partial [Lachnospiraceae bacterium]